MKYSLEQLDGYCYDKTPTKTAIAFSIPRACGIEMAWIDDSGRCYLIIQTTPDPAVAQVVPPMGRAMAALNVVVAPEPPTATFDAYPRAEQARVLDRVLADAGVPDDRCTCRPGPGRGDKNCPAHGDDFRDLERARRDEKKNPVSAGDSDGDGDRFNADFNG